MLLAQKKCEDRAIFSKLISVRFNLKNVFCKFTLLRFLHRSTVAVTVYLSLYKHLRVKLTRKKTMLRILLTKKV